MSTSQLEATHVGSSTPVETVLILSRLLLISQAVGAALRGRGFDAEAVAWAPGVRRAVEELTESDMVMLFDDLEGREAVIATQSLVTQSSARFLVLTHRPEGAAWGAMLASGAAAVMPTESSLAEVVATLMLVRGGASPISEVRRSRLVREWFRWLAEDDSLRARVADLSPREREVLGLLLAGSRVGDIVADLGVAETTVRSHIRSIRRKLDVGSQLAAVAVVHRLGSTLVGGADSAERGDAADLAGSGPRPATGLRPFPPSPRQPQI